MDETKRNLIIVMIGMISAMLMFSACDMGSDEMNSANSSSVINTTIGTFLKESDSAYLIDSDKGNKLYVTNAADLLNNGFTPGQRIYAEFSGAVMQVPYVGPIKVTYAYPVLVKDIAVATSNMADDPIDALRIWNSRNFLNIQYIIMTSGTYTHNLELVTVAAPKQKEDGYQYLELRHGLNGNTPMTNFVGIASFDISKYLADSSLKGFIVRYKSLNGKETFAKCELDRNNSDIVLDPAPNSEMGSALLVE